MRAVGVTVHSGPGWRSYGARDDVWFHIPQIE